MDVCRAQHLAANSKSQGHNLTRALSEAITFRISSGPYPLQGLCMFIMQVLPMSGDVSRTTLSHQLSRSRSQLGQKLLHSKSRVRVISLAKLG